MVWFAIGLVIIVAVILITEDSTKEIKNEAGVDEDWVGLANRGRFSY